MKLICYIKFHKNVILDTKTSYFLRYLTFIIWILSYICRGRHYST